MGNSGDASLTFAGVAVTNIISQQPTQIILMTPPGVFPTTGHVTVVSPTAGTATLSLAWTYAPRMFSVLCALLWVVVYAYGFVAGEISFFIPPAGPRLGGYTLTILVRSLVSLSVS